MKWLIQSYGWNCSDDRTLARITSYQQKYIVMLHNQWRNKIALGNIDGYKPARRMPVMVRFYLRKMNQSIEIH